jgi:hypothetical protein
MGGVNLVVSCTKRKARPARASLRLRDLDSAGGIVDRAVEWLRRLRAERSDLTPAGDLYSGDHWAVVRSLAGRTPANGLPVRVWVCSAGYGLVTPASRLAPYDATFTSGQPDSVVPPGHPAPRKALREWWATLGTWKGPPGAGCRSIAAVAASYPGDFLLVALSFDYLTAVADDLRKAAATLPQPHRLAVICAGADGLDGLDAHLLPCDARLRPLAGGALASLNVRLAARLLESSRKDLSLAGCRSLFQRWMSAQPGRAAPARVPMTDEEVRGFIRTSLAGDPRLRPTPLLRRLRKQGKACEHGRFARLFQEVRGLSHAS